MNKAKEGKSVNQPRESIKNNNNAPNNKNKNKFVITQESTSHPAPQIVETPNNNKNFTKSAHSSLDTELDSISPSKSKEKEKEKEKEIKFPKKYESTSKKSSTQKIDDAISSNNTTKANPLSIPQRDTISKKATKINFVVSIETDKSDENPLPPTSVFNSLKLDGGSPNKESSIIQANIGFDIFNYLYIF